MNRESPTRTLACVGSSDPALVWSHRRAPGKTVGRAEAYDAYCKFELKEKLTVMIRVVVIVSNPSAWRGVLDELAGIPIRWMRSWSSPQMHP
jgi:hypothetical protein